MNHHRLNNALAVLGWITGAALSAGTLAWARAFQQALRRG